MALSDWNADRKVISDFGAEWSIHDQRLVSNQDLQSEFDKYFANFPWSKINQQSIGADFGAGSGRWAKFVAPRVGRLFLVEPSKAILAAKEILSDCHNVEFCQSTISDNNINDGSLDFFYCLGVLHHLPDPENGLLDCVRKLKPNGILLIYFYYNLDNRTAVYKSIWKIANLVRLAICYLPSPIKIRICWLLCLVIYVPLVWIAKIGRKVGLNISNWLLAAYVDRSYKSLQTDTLDRFATRIEWRKSRSELEVMLKNMGIVDLKFNEHSPYHCVVGRKAENRDSH